MSSEITLFNLFLLFANSVLILKELLDTHVPEDWFESTKLAKWKEPDNLVFSVLFDISVKVYTF